MQVVAQKRISQKRMALQINSPNGKSKDVMSDYLDLKSYSDKGKKKADDKHRLGSKSNSKQSIAISMRDESILQMSVNSVTDERNYLRHDDENSTDSNNNYYSIKKQMIRYLSRVADRNKPMFVFNQKLNLGRDSSDDSDTGTPSFSLVALIHDR